MVKQFKWYPAEDKERQVRTKKTSTPKLRKGLEPGRVLILLSGRFRGHRVVFLKQLESGLLLVTGPHKLNGVPLKRVNQVYTLTTSTKVNVAGVDDSKVSDNTFTRDNKTKKADAKAQEEWDEDNFEETPKDHHPSIACHRVMADNVIKRIERLSL